MGVFGKVTNNTGVNTKGAEVKKAPMVKKGTKVTPVKTLRVKAPGAAKSEFLTGLFQDQGKNTVSGKDKEGNRYIVFTNDDNTVVLSYVPAGEKDLVRLTRLFESEGQWGPYASGKSKDGHQFIVAEYKPRQEA